MYRIFENRPLTTWPRLHFQLELRCSSLYSHREHVATCGSRPVNLLSHHQTTKIEFEVSGADEMSFQEDALQKIALQTPPAEEIFLAGPVQFDVFH